jgi:hypothetical protein
MTNKENPEEDVYYSMFSSTDDEGHIIASIVATDTNGKLVTSEPDFYNGNLTFKFRPKKNTDSDSESI